MEIIYPPLRSQQFFYPCLIFPHFFVRTSKKWSLLIFKDDTFTLTKTFVRVAYSDVKLVFT